MFYMQVNMHEAKSSFSKLAEKAWEGEAVMIVAQDEGLVLVVHDSNTKRYEIRTFDSFQER